MTYDTYIYGLKLVDIKKDTYVMEFQKKTKEASVFNRYVYSIITNQEYEASQLQIKRDFEENLRRNRFRIEYALYKRELN